MFQEEINHYKQMLERDDLDDEERAYYNDAIKSYTIMTVDECRAEYEQDYTSHKAAVGLAHDVLSQSFIDAESYVELFNYFRPDYAEQKEDGEWYIDFMFDTVCRVIGFPEESFTDVEALISWLYTYDQDCILDKDEQGEYIEPHGMTPRLADKLRKLWKDNGSALYVEFG